MRRNSTLSATYSAKTDFDDDQMDDFQDEEAQDAPTQEQGQKQAADQEIEQRSQLDERDIESQTPNLSLQPVTSGIRSEVATEHRTLYLAALRDDWKAAEPIVRNKPSLARVAITRRDERVLHVAVAAKSTKFVEGLVDLMDKEDLKLKNTGGSTAFCFAAASGVVEIARAMAEKNEELANIRGEGRMAPITMAALFGNKAMVSYLHNVTNLKALEKSERFDLLEGTIQNDMYDVALALFKEDKTLATYRPAENHSILNMLAKKSVKISSRNLERKSERFIHRRACSLVWGMFTWLKIVRELREKTLLKMKASELLEELWKECSENLAEDELMRLVSETNILHSAAKEGNVEFLALLIRDYPDLVWDVNQKGQTIFHVAVLHRQEKVFSLVHQIGAIKDLITLIIDDEDNYILHLAGKLGEPVLRVNKKTPGPGQQQLGEMEEKIMPTSFLNVSGAALRLQKELLWFKEVETIVPPLILRKENKGGKTPRQLFTEEHQLLLKEGEKWMRDTANYCMIVATLIATVMFAAAFTVPGGNNDVEGTPIMIQLKGFTVFVVSDAVAMFSSIVSIIMFLSILTSPYTEDDFLVSLPNKLLFGLTTLFASIVGMLLAFSATFVLVYSNHMAWEPMLIAASGAVPVALFGCLHYKLWWDTVKSTYLSKYLFKPRKNGLRLY